MGLSCVEIDHIDMDGPVIYLKGADLMDGTPIYDIKPYISYADSHPDALGGYVDRLEERKLEVVLPEDLEDKIADKLLAASLVEVLSLDPRPSYHDDPEREYGLSFAGMNVRFKVFLGILTVVAID